MKSIGLVVPFLLLLVVPAAGQLGPNEISGRVLGKNLYGELVPLTWARVVAYSGGAIVTAASTSDSGFYIMFLPPGTYEIAVYYPGFVTQRQSVTASGGILANINFYLEQGLALYVKTDPEIIGGIAGEGTYPRGAAVTLNVTKPIVEIGKGKRYIFAGWVGDVTSDKPSLTVVMDTSKNLVAKYKVQHSLTIYQPNAQPLERWFDAGAGAVTPSAAAEVESGPGARMVFQTWTVDGTPVAGNPAKVVMDRPRNASAYYKTQFYVKVASDVGRPSGEGWYDAGTTAILTATSEMPMEGVLGTLGGKQAFSGWSGDVQSNANPLSVKVTRPYTIRANWSTDYSQPSAIIGGAVIALVLLLALLVLRKGRPKRS